VAWDKNVDVNIRARDKTKKGVQQATRNLRSAAADVRRSTSTMVSEQAGRSLSQFNEKTEKGRQLLVAFGGAVGGAAGNVVYYAGTLSYVVGRFKLWELAIMAVTAVIGGLVWMLTRQSEQEKEWNKRLETSKKRLDQLTASVDQFIAAQNQNIEGWSAAERKLSEVNDELESQHRNYQQAIKDIKEWENSAPAIEVLEKQYPEHLVRAYWQSLLGLGQAQKMSTKLVEVDAKVKEKAFDAELKRQQEEEKKEAQRRAQELARKKDLEAQSMLSQTIPMFERDQRKLGAFYHWYEGWLVSIEDAYANSTDNIHRMMEENADRAEKVRRNEIQRYLDDVQKQIDADEAAAKKREENIGHTVDMVSTALDATAQLTEIYDLFGESSAKTAKERARAEGMRLAFINTIDALTETALAAGAYAIGDIFGGTQHAIAAGLHWAAAAAAGGNPEKAGGYSGGGGAGGYDNRRSTPGSSYFGDNQRQKGGGDTYILKVGRGGVLIQTEADYGRVFREGAQMDVESQSPGATWRDF